MKRFLMLVVSLFVISVAVQAQDSTAKKVSLRDELSMTKEQVAKYKEITAKSKEAAAAVDADATLDAAAKKAKKKELTAAKDAEFEAILSEEQKVKLKAYQEKQKAERAAAKKAKQ